MFRMARHFIRYSKQFGFLNALIFSIFKIFPNCFVLLSVRLNDSINAQWREAAAAKGVDIASEVFDFVPWQDLGGAESAISPSDSRKCFIWFVPDWSNVWGGGHYTLFRFANHFGKFGTRNIIYIYNNQRHRDPEFLEKELYGAINNCTLEVIVDPKKLPACAGAIATTWQSAYHVKAFEFAQKKFYFMQDYECLFYASGTSSMQANASYTFDFVGITGGRWLKRCYESYGGKAQNYVFCADKNIFYPNSSDGKVSSAVKRVFFYGRPSTERRCFELGMAALKKISVAFPDVEIIIAGLDLQCAPSFKATLLGNMSLDATGQLYRTCDIGIAFSATNLSYLPVELMASGVPVISNNGPHVEWHCRHLENAYLVDPIPQSVFEAFTILYHDIDLRQKLASGGLETMKNLTWENEMTVIYNYVIDNLGPTDV